MRTWFEFKGVNSNNMDVLLSSTPPIIRPGIRYNANEIDGIDGCTIEHLGYSAYEKIVEIGIKDANRLPEIMDWLSGSGKLTFHNEPDLYYNAEVLQQIEYNKALRFYKSSVYFLVQPYKKAILEPSTTRLRVNNNGNVKCLPYIKITGKGDVSFFVNNEKVCDLSFGDNERVLELDSETQDCLYNGNLSNRSMNGDFPVLSPGINLLSYSGDVSKVETDVRSRWL